MKAIKGVGLFAVTAIAISSCFNPPEFAIEPQIDIESLSFGDSPDNPTDPQQDSLVVSIKFKDGDGDLGLDANNPLHKEAPFNANNFFLAQDGEIKPVGSYRPYSDILFDFVSPGNTTGKLVTYKTRTLPGYDFLPAFENAPCSYVVDTVFVSHEHSAILDKTIQNIYDTLYSSNPEHPQIYELRDTFYIAKNPDYNNITVDFLVKQPNGTYTIYDWGGCEEPFHGRFPILSDKVGSPLDGVLRYSIKSNGLKPLFLTQTIKLRIQIKDRALHHSNVLETREFTLLEILR